MIRGGRQKDPVLVAVVGAINWDVTIFEDRFANPGEEVPVRKVEEYPGGKGANVAVAISRILGRGKVSLVGAVGDDKIATSLLSDLEVEGVGADAVAKLKGTESGRAYVVVDQAGRKTIHTQLGANEGLGLREISNTATREVLRASSTVVVMDPPTNVAIALMKTARKLGARVVYSPGVRTMEGLHSVDSGIKLADIVVLDSNELRHLYQTTPEVAASRLVDKYPRTKIVATLGPRGCLVTKQRSLVRVPAANLSRLGLKAVNSTGSGDAFLGALVSYTAMGTSLRDAAVRANLAGALKAANLQTRGSPTRTELESKLRILAKLRRSRPGSTESRSG